MMDLVRETWDVGIRGRVVISYMTFDYKPYTTDYWYIPILTLSVKSLTHSTTSLCAIN